MQLLQITLLIGFHRLKGAVKIPFHLCAAVAGTVLPFGGAELVRKGARGVRMDFIAITILTIYRKCVLIFYDPKENFGRAIKKYTPTHHLSEQCKYSYLVAKKSLICKKSEAGIFENQ